MKIKLTICILYFVITVAVGCESRGNEQIESGVSVMTENNGYEEQTEQTTTEKIEETEEITTEWVNPYLENYKIVSKEIVERDPLIDYEIMMLPNVLESLASDKARGREAYVAVVTLADVGETVYSIEGVQWAFSAETPITMKVDKILESSVDDYTMKEGDIVEANVNIIWRELDDGTYEVQYRPAAFPITEIGSKYVVYMDGYSCIYGLTRPFKDDGTYTYTVVACEELGWFLSDSVLWYYDINADYYKEYWDNHVEEFEAYKNNGVDVYDKNWFMDY